MRKPSLILVTLFLLTVVIAQDKPSEGLADIHRVNRQLGRGINLGNALEAPREGDWGVTLRAEFFKAIKEAGFDTVRLPVKWSAHAKTAAPYTIDVQFLERVDWAIGQALEQKLNVILNVHHYGEIDGDPDGQLPRLTAVWEQISKRYQDKPTSVLFELLNEPHDKLTEGKWNATVLTLLTTIRRTNPSRPVIVGPSPWNAIWPLDKLELPQDDRRLIVTFHFYDPYEFTHQGASWVKGSDKWKGRPWTGTDAEKTAIRTQFDKVTAWAKKHDRPVFLGEFGAFGAADMDSRSRWAKFIVQEAEQRGFSWCYWEFCAGFGAYDAQSGRWREPLKAALVK